MGNVATPRSLPDRKLQLRLSEPLELLQVTAVCFNCQQHLLPRTPADQLPLLATSGSAHHHHHLLLHSVVRRCSRRDAKLHWAAVSM